MTREDLDSLRPPITAFRMQSPIWSVALSQARATGQPAVRHRERAAVRHGVCTRNQSVGAVPDALAREPGLFDQWLVRFIKVDLRISWIIGLRRDLQHVFHRRDTFGAHLRDPPVLLQSRLEVAFFQTRRTRSYEYDSARHRGPPGATLASTRRELRCDSSLGLEQCRQGSALFRCQHWRGSIAHSLLSKLILQQP